MKRLIFPWIFVSLFAMLFFGCDKQKDCSSPHAGLLYIDVVRARNVQNPSLDTAFIFSAVYKNKSGYQLPTLQINGRPVGLADDGEDICDNLDARFYKSDTLLNYSQPGYLLIGQSNTLKLSSERTGIVIDSFKMPREIGVKPLPSTIIHKNQDLVFTITGYDNSPAPFLPSDNYSDFTEEVGILLAYKRDISDTITYPSLPRTMNTIGKPLTPGTTTVKFTASEVNYLPSNGTVHFLLYRYATYYLPNTAKGSISIHAGHANVARYIIKD